MLDGTINLKSDTQSAANFKCPFATSNKIILIPERGFRVKFEDFAAYAFRNGASTNSVLLARVNPSKVESVNFQFNQLIKTGKYFHDCVILY